MGTIQKTVREIKSLKIQGASKIGEKAVEALAKAGSESSAKTAEEFRKEFLKNSKLLFYARPTEPALRAAIRILRKSISREGLSAQEMKTILRKTAENYEKEWQNSLEKIKEYGAELIEPGSTILTLCHSTLVVEVLKKAKKKIKAVYCCETRPLYQGRITAKELSDAGIKVFLIADNAASTVLKKCDYFFTGADAFLADGDVINKIGTKQISLLCKNYSTKHYVVCTTNKFEPASFFGKDEPIEERNPKEVWEKAPKKIKVLNHAFDRTDSQLIEGIVCELGIFPPEALASKLYDKLKLEDSHEDFLHLEK
ncbi:MAG: S-methyl-5-thioribose-1-phosphate isomerase [Candidatus Diapherotrites archaeon]|nr:S-methyl-5-thioribose-1-phosphate isomerase [Candidatus Diapherotrites archaeon]